MENKIVFRRFDKPVDKIEIKEQQSYMIRGYFLRTIGNGYQFIAPNPVIQFWDIFREVSEYGCIISVLS